VHQRLAPLSVAALLSVLYLAPQAFALTVSLPELTGDYEVFQGVAPDFGAPGYRSIDFVLPEGITSIDQVTVVLSGQWHAGELSCDTGFGTREISQFLPPLAVALYSSAFESDFFLASVEVPDGEFEGLAVGFSSCCPPGVLDFDSMIGAELQIELFIDWVLVGNCFATEDSYGSLADVSIEVSGPVSTDSSSWGGIKSLYR